MAASAELFLANGPEQPVADFDAELLPDGMLNLIRQRAVEEIENGTRREGPIIHDIPNIGTVFVEDCTDIGATSLPATRILNPAEPEYGLDAAGVIEVTKTHLEKARELGLMTISHSLELREGAAEELKTHTFAPQIIVAHKFIKLTAPVYTVPMDDITTDQSQTKIVKPVKEYYNWCLENKEPYYLIGLNNSSHYRVDDEDNIFYDGVEPEVWFSVDGCLTSSVERTMPYFEKHIMRDGPNG